MVPMSSFVKGRQVVVMSLIIHRVMVHGSIFVCGNIVTWHEYILRALRLPATSRYSPYYSAHAAVSLQVSLALPRSV